jgi:hypothetical protein
MQSFPTARRRWTKAICFCSWEIRSCRRRVIPAVIDDDRHAPAARPHFARRRSDCCGSTARIRAFRGAAAPFVPSRAGGPLPDNLRRASHRQFTDQEAISAMPDNMPPIASAAELRIRVLEREMARAERQRAARAVEQEKHAQFVRDFCNGHITDRERDMIRQLVRNAVADGKLETLIYSFPADACIDRGRAINNAAPDWPKTLRGKARELYELYEERGKPAGYRLKAMIISFPGGMLGDVGFYLSWAGDDRPGKAHSD